MLRNDLLYKCIDSQFGSCPEHLQQSEVWYTPILTFACDLKDNLFSYERISTRTHFEKKGGLHVVWKLLNTVNFVRSGYFSSETGSRQSRNLQLTRPSQQEEKHFWVSDLISAMGGHP